MSLTNLVLTLIPMFVLFFIVGLSGNWLEQTAREYARRELNLDQLQDELRRASKAISDRNRTIEEKRDLVAERERSLAAINSKLGDEMTQEIRLTDPRQSTVYEIGVPMQHMVGMYAKAVGPGTVAPYDGRGSVPSGVHGRRFARFVIWGRDQAQLERTLKQWVGPQGQVLVQRPFSGKLKLTEL